MEIASIKCDPNFLEFAAEDAVSFVTRNLF